ncbi:MAG TPA: ATP-binding protein, partial [Gemmatimonadaceae bacterium]
MHFISLLPFPVLGIDAEGIIRESNEALERELGVGAPLTGQPLTAIVDEDTREVAARVIGAHAAGEPVVQLRFAASPHGLTRTFYIVPEGNTRWLIGQPAEFDEQREALARAHQRAEAQTDEYARVSQELRTANELLAGRAQALVEASQAKARFLATMSHELRTPLNAVLGYAGLLRDGVYGAISEQQERAVQSIVRRSRDLQLLIDDVLDLSKIEAGRVELRVDEFDPSAVLAEVREAVSGFANAKGLRISLRTRTRRRVRLDRAKYKQVLLNLASNAVKFTPEGGEMELSVEEEGDDVIATTVRDTGIGIASTHLPHIFDNFEQVESGTTRRFQGIGLGLAIVKRTVDLLGGTIQVESEPGRGTAFTIRFPIGQESEALVGETGTQPGAVEQSSDPIVLAI